MGGRVGILDADVHGPSLPTMISPEPRVMIMDPATRVRACHLSPLNWKALPFVVWQTGVAPCDCRNNVLISHS
jgi:hypothetical protein